MASFWSFANGQLSIKFLQSNSVSDAGGLWVLIGIQAISSFQKIKSGWFWLYTREQKSQGTSGVP